MASDIYTVKAQYFKNGEEIGHSEAQVSHEGALHVVRDVISNLALNMLHNRVLEQAREKG